MAEAWRRPGLRPSLRARLQLFLRAAKSARAVSPVFGQLLAEFPDMTENELRLVLRRCWERLCELEPCIEMAAAELERQAALESGLTTLRGVVLP